MTKHNHIQDAPQGWEQYARVLSEHPGYTAPDALAARTDTRIDTSGKATSGERGTGGQRPGARRFSGLTIAGFAALILLAVFLAPGTIRHYGGYLPPGVDPNGISVAEPANNGLIQPYMSSVQADTVLPSAIISDNPIVPGSIEAVRSNPLYLYEDQYGNMVPSVAFPDAVPGLPR